MASREGSLWSRAWGAIALLAFAVMLGAVVYEAAVIAPLWSLSPPASVVAWMTREPRPDSSTLFHPLVAVLVVATGMAWITGIATRGWRRWWLTLALAAAAALTAVTVILVLPAEQSLLDAAARGDADPARVTALTGDWVRGAAMRLAALLVGAWAGYRAQLAGAVAAAAVSASERQMDEFEGISAVSGARPARDFSFGDEDEPEITVGDEAPNPRQRWRDSLPSRRRTAKK